MRSETSAPIVSLIAARGDGLDELVAAIDAHHRSDNRARRLARARRADRAGNGCRAVALVLRDGTATG